MTITKNSEHFKMEGYRGYWSVVDSKKYCIKNQGFKTFFLLESDNWGDETPSIVTDSDGRVYDDDTHDGFLNFEEQILEIV